MNTDKRGWFELLLFYPCSSVVIF